LCGICGNLEGTQAVGSDNARAHISIRIMSIPIHPALTDENLKDIAHAVEKVANHYS
jgi:dTDP-4-amino-4,6-dideoxygalactose transaminase